MKDSPLAGLRGARLLLGTVAVLGLLLTACSGDDVDASESAVADDLAATSSSSTTTAAPTTETTEATTSSTLTAAEEEEALVAELMATADGYWTGYLDCLADIATCDIERDLGDVVGQPLKGELESVVAELAADGTSIRGEDPDQYYRRHDKALDDPLTYALELCAMTGTGELIREGADGEIEVVEPAGEAVPRFEQLALQEGPDGGFLVVTTLSSDEAVEAENCDEYRE